MTFSTMTLEQIRDSLTDFHNKMDKAGLINPDINWINDQLEKKGYSRFFNPVKHKLVFHDSMQTLFTQDVPSYLHFDECIPVGEMVIIDITHQYDYPKGEMFE